MDIDEVRDYCMSKKGATEGFVFNNINLGFKVQGKLFLLASLEGILVVNIKCSPSWSDDLRNRYSAVQPGYLMNKKHWNTVYLDGSLPDNLIKKLIDHSYTLVVAGLSRKLRAQIE